MPGALRLLVLGSPMWSDQGPIRQLLDLVRPDVVLHPATDGAALVAHAVAGELGISSEGLTVAPYETEGRYRDRLLEAARPTLAALFVTGRAGSTASDLDGGLCSAVLHYRRGVGDPSGRLPVVVYREDGIAIPELRTKTPRTHDLQCARHDLRRLWESVAWAQVAIMPAGRAAAAALRVDSLGPGLSGDLAERLTEALRAVEALRRAEPRLAPWLAATEEVFRRWAPKSTATTQLPASS